MTTKKTTKKKNADAGLVRRNVHMGPEYGQAMAAAKSCGMTTASFIRQAVKARLKIHGFRVTPEV